VPSDISENIHAGFVNHTIQFQVATEFLSDEIETLAQKCLGGQRFQNRAESLQEKGMRISRSSVLKSKEDSFPIIAKVNALP
jgi:hypothetical protein